MQVVHKNNVVGVLDQFSASLQASGAGKFCAPIDIRISRRRQGWGDELISSFRERMPTRSAGSWPVTHSRQGSALQECLNVHVGTVKVDNDKMEVFFLKALNDADQVLHKGTKVSVRLLQTAPLKTSQRTCTRWMTQGA